MYVCMSFSPCPNAHNDDWQSEGFRELLDVNGVVSRREYSTPADDESLKAIHLVVRVFFVRMNTTVVVPVYSGCFHVLPLPFQSI